jgi:hypothetical protein
VVCDEQGLAVFDLLRRGDRVKQNAHLVAFDQRAAVDLQKVGPRGRVKRGVLNCHEAPWPSQAGAFIQSNTST